MTVLLLDASHRPLKVIPKRRAFSLWLRGRVDGVTDDAVTLKGGSAEFHIPAVLRLRRYIHVPQRHARWSRAGVFRRDEHRCIYCGLVPGERQGRRLLTKADFTVDHILPRCRGGRNTWSNTACACRRCNQRKGSRMPHEMSMRLRWEPKTPRVDYLVASGDIPESWKIYFQLPVREKDEEPGPSAVGRPLATLAEPSRP